MYNFVGAWVTRKRKEIFGDIEGDPADHPQLVQQLKQAVDNNLKIDYIVTGGCTMNMFYSFLFSFLDMIGRLTHVFFTRVTESIS